VIDRQDLADPTARAEQDLPAEVVAWVGQRLRSVREQKQLSLSDVDQLSEGDFCTSTVGAYERGTRSISVPRLRELANFYGVAIGQLLPNGKETTLFHGWVPNADQPLTIDIVKLNWLGGPTFQAMLRYIASVQQQRNDYRPDLITLRGTDTLFIAAVFAIPVAEVTTRLAALDLLYATAELPTKIDTTISI
jgi:transcriptional regulator with XRE-family HTH domain